MDWTDSSIRRPSSSSLLRFFLSRYPEGVNHLEKNLLAAEKKPSRPASWGVSGSARVAVKTHNAMMVFNGIGMACKLSIRLSGMSNRKLLLQHTILGVFCWHFVRAGSIVIRSMDFFSRLLFLFIVTATGCFGGLGSNSLFSRLLRFAKAEALPHIDRAGGRLNIGNAKKKLDLVQFKYRARLLNDTELVVLMQEMQGGAIKGSFEEEIRILNEEISSRGIRFDTVEVLVARLERALKGAKTASDVFDVFDEFAAANPDPGDPYRDALAKFFGDNIEAIFALNPALDSIERVHRYVGRDALSVLLVGGFIKRAFGMLLDGARTPWEFFNAFDRFESKFPKPPNLIRGVLEEFVVARAEDVLALGPSDGEIKRLSRYIRTAGANVALLEARLGRARDAADFFRLFYAFADYITDPSAVYRRALEKFFIARADAVVALGPSADDMRRVHGYVASQPVIEALRAAVVRRYGRSSGGVCRTLFDPLL